MSRSRWLRQMGELELLLHSSPVQQPHSRPRRVVKRPETSDSTDNESETESIGSQPTRISKRERPLTPEVRYYNLTGYLDLMNEDKDDCVIEAFMTHTANWMGEVKVEIRRLREQVRAKGSMLAIETDAAPIAIASSEIEAFGKSFRLRRVKVRSTTVLRALSNLIDDDEFEGRPIVFPRPFITLRDTYQRMKTRLAEMERAVASRDLGSSFSENHTPGSTGHDSDHLAAGTGYNTNSPQAAERALQDMRCYIQFVETDILPIWDSVKPNVGPGPSLVEFEDIPCIFQENDLIYVPKGDLRQSAHKCIWKLGGILSQHKHDQGQRVFICNLFCLDYNGDKVEAIRREIKIDYFPNQKDIRALGCYPIPFHVNPTAVLKEAEKIGSQFLFCIQKRSTSLLYSGWNFVTGIAGEPLEDEYGEITAAEYIESEVIIDFKEALRTHPEWGQRYYTASKAKSRKGARRSRLVPPFRPIRASRPPAQDSSSDSASGPPVAVTPVRELMGWDDMVSAERYRLVCESRPVLKDGGEGISIDQLTNDEIMLMPRRMFAYVLRERRFMRLDVQGVDQNHQQKQVTLDDIQMNETHKKIIRSSVSSHLDAQSKEKLSGEFDLDIDIIHGKGKSLIILLHGAPGVGKTATAEAIAMERNRPLFPISCADLGFFPSSVEKTLRDIFRYAHLWECILLLDEADVFLTQRERGGDNLERNAIVGVFLRTLEYYSGILFLTTNRVGALDEAFRSRVHISLWYPYLSLADTISILRSNLGRLPRWDKSKISNRGLIKVMYKEIEDFIRREYEDYSKAVKKNRGPWNGRQIRNAVQVAACLALYDKKNSEDEDLPAILTAEHFRTVAETTREFENFLKITKVGDDEYLARQRQERVDDFGGRGGPDDMTRKVTYTRYKSRDNPRPSQNTTKYGRSSRSGYSEDQYESPDNEDIDFDQQVQERRRGKATIPRHLNEEYDMTADRARQHHLSDIYNEDDTSQLEAEDDEPSSLHRNRGGEGGGSTNRVREREHKHGAILTDRRRRGDEYDRY
ncbi:hypothetical protein F5Y10DRAFT_111639 [Nemania abortiva]|nr:hypothetical protein F5Y10DRAFT_111639 [Nemania abortiva]